MTYVYLIGIAAVLLILWLMNGVRKIGSVSSGEQIAKCTGEALLLIDLQTVFWEDGPYSDADKRTAEHAILAEVESAQAKGQPVIAVRQEWSHPSTKAVAKLTMKGQAVQGSAGVELAKAFAEHPDHVLVKRVQDAFETGELDALLEQLDVGQLRVAGLDLNYCVMKTALAARNRGYEVAVVKAATLAAADSTKAEAQMASAGISFA